MKTRIIAVLVITIIASFFLYLNRSAVRGVSLNFFKVPGSTPKPIAFTPAQSLIFVEHAFSLFDRSLSGGRRYSINGHTLHIKRIGATVCVAGEIGDGVRMVSNEDGTFLLINGGAYRLDFIKQAQTGLSKDFIGAGIPSLLPGCDAEFKESKSGVTYLFLVKNPEDVLLKEAHAIQENLFKKTSNNRASAEAILQQLPASEEIAITPNGAVLSVAQFNKNRQLFLNRTITIDPEYSIPLSSELFADPSGTSIIPVRSLEEFQLLVAGQN